MTRLVLFCFFALVMVFLSSRVDGAIHDRMVFKRSCGGTLVARILRICGEPCETTTDLASLACASLVSDDYIKETCCPTTTLLQ